MLHQKAYPPNYIYTHLPKTHNLLLKSTIKATEPIHNKDLPDSSHPLLLEYIFALGLQQPRPPHHQ